MKTTIDKYDNGNWIWCSTSHTATEDDPCQNHTADLGEEVYEALEDAWADRDGDSVDVEVDGTTYSLGTDD